MLDDDDRDGWAARGRRMLERLPGRAVMLVDESFRLLWATDNAAELVGLTSVPYGTSIVDRLHPDDLEFAFEVVTMQQRRAERLGAAFGAMPAMGADVRVRRDDGTYRTFHTTIHNRVHDPDVEALVVTIDLVGDRVSLPTVIERLGAGAPLDDVITDLCRLIAGEVPESTVVLHWWDDDGHHFDASRALPPELTAPSMMEAALVERRVVSYVDLAGLPSSVADQAGLEGFLAAWVIPIEPPGGGEPIAAATIWVPRSLDLVLHPQLPLHLGLRLVSLAVVDHRVKAALRRAASRDPLTGAVNRTELFARLEGFGRPEHLPLAALYVDLDGFKPINDRFGHAAGDAVLSTVVTRLEAVMRRGDVVARVGGDEFVVVCPAVGDVESATTVAARLLAELREPISAFDRVHHVAASVGLAMAQSVEELDDVVERADAAMYDAKRAGGGAVVLHRRASRRRPL